MKKKIAFLIQNLEGGGAERVVLNIINNINLEYFEVTLVMLENRGIYLKQLKNRKGVKIITFSNCLKSRYLNFAINYMKALYYMKKEKFDVIFSQYNPAKIFSFFKFLYKDTILVYRETNVTDAENRLKKGIIKWIYEIFYKYGINKYDKIIVQSIDMKKSLIGTAKNVDLEKIYLINNPIDIENIENKLLVEKTEQIFLKLNSIKLISVGRLSYQKGFDMLIETLSKLDDMDFELLILGEGQDRERLQAQIDDKKLNSKVRLYGFVENPYKSIAEADYFISSSRFEGFPNAVLEACACGIPVIANNYPGGINEIIRKKLNGEIIDIMNPTEFKEACLKKYDSQKIKEDIKNRFSVEKIVKKYERVFN